MDAEVLDPVLAALELELEVLEAEVLEAEVREVAVEVGAAGTRALINQSINQSCN